MELFEANLDAILKTKTLEVEALLEVKADAKQQRAEEKAAAIESGTVIEKPKRGRKKIDIPEIPVTLDTLESDTTTVIEKPKRGRKKKEIIN